jgi:undecaprenyl phosphate N,N'-diacetylbacillosamine 1-phosphate transferase
MYGRFIKRPLDIFFSFILLAATSWMWLIVFVALKLSRDRSVFFKQERSGKKGKIFMILKFRTLRVDASLPLSERRLWFGDLLRATSLDELPQLINILKGEMSLIGPRPLPVEYWPLMNDVQRIRADVLPGITGWAQVHGRNAIPWEQKFSLDAYYVRNISFWLDLVIVVKTIFVLLSFKKDISLREKPFTGS